MGFGWGGVPNNDNPAPSPYTQDILAGAQLGLNTTPVIDMESYLPPATTSYSVDYGDGSSGDSGTINAQFNGLVHGYTNLYYSSYVIAIGLNNHTIVSGTYALGVLQLVHDYTTTGYYTITVTMGGLSQLIYLYVEEMSVIENSPASGNAIDYVGSKITLAGKFNSNDPNANITSIQWTITGPDGNDGLIAQAPTQDNLGYHYQTVKTWTDTNNTGQRQAQLNATQYYWGNLSGSYTVSAVISYADSVGNHQKTIPATIAISTPTIDTTVSWGKVFGLSIPNPGGGFVDRLGTGAPGGPGGGGNPTIPQAIDTFLQIPAGQSLGTGATFAVVQTVSSGFHDKAYRSFDRQWYAASTFAKNDGAIDSGIMVDYGWGSRNPPFYINTLTTYDNANGSIVELIDYPFLDMPLSFQSLIVADTFNDYVMFTPGGGVIVPVMYSAWSYGGRIQANPNGTISLTSKQDPNWQSGGPGGNWNWTAISNTANASVAVAHNKPAWSSNTNDYIDANGIAHFKRVNNLNDPDVTSASAVASYALDIAYGYYAPIANAYSSKFGGSAFNSYSHPFGLSDLPGDWATQTFNVYKYNGSYQLNNDTFNNYIYTPTDVSGVIASIPTDVVVGYCFDRFDNPSSRTEKAMSSL